MSAFKSIATVAVLAGLVCVSTVDANAQSFKKFVKNTNGGPSLRTIPMPGGPQVVPSPGGQTTPFVMPVQPAPVHPTPAPVYPKPGCSKTIPMPTVIPSPSPYPTPAPVPAQPVLGAYLLPVSMHTGGGLVQGLKVTSVYRHRALYGEDAFGTQRQYRFRAGADVILAINGVQVSRVCDVKQNLNYGWNTLSVWDSATHAYGDYQIFID